MIFYSICFISLLKFKLLLILDSLYRIYDLKDITIFNKILKILQI